jgi:hypothetical protein
MYRVNDFDQIQVGAALFRAALHFVQLGSHSGNQLLRGGETETNGAPVSASNGEQRATSQLGNVIHGGGDA